MTMPKIQEKNKSEETINNIALDDHNDTKPEQIIFTPGSRNDPSKLSRNPRYSTILSK